MSMIGSLPPFLPFLFGGLFVLLTRGGLRGAVMLATILFGVANLYAMPMGETWQVAIFGYEMTLVRADRLSMLFGYLFHLAAFLGTIYALHVKDTTQQLVGMLYPGAALGAVFAGDLISLFMFWELLAVTSVFLIWARRTERSYRAGMRYLIIQVSSGVVLLAGVMIWAHETGSLAFGFIGLGTIGGPAEIGALLIFLAFGVKAAFPLLHNWLTDSYPEATPTGTVLLSAFTTKVAVYALARAYPGTESLIYIGAAMTMFPIFFAVIENDLRRVLAYSLINQVGFMICGIGIGTELAINGAIAHAFNDVVFKGLLFMTMGAVLMRTGKINGSELGGLYKSMPWTATFCIVGAASISAFPLFSGFVSKSMVMVAALEEGHTVVWLGLLFASAGVFHHAGIKIPFFAFFSHDAGHRVKEAPPNMLLAMGLAAAICIFNGSYPAVLYGMLPFAVDYSPYDMTHVLAQAQLLFFSALAFTWLKLSNLYPPELPSVNLDAEWIYRRVVPRALKGMVRVLAPIDAMLRTNALSRIERFIDGVFRHHGPESIMARTRPVGTTVMWVAVLLAGYLLVYLF